MDFEDCHQDLETRLENIRSNGRRIVEAATIGDLERVIAIAQSIDCDAIEGYSRNKAMYDLYYTDSLTGLRSKAYYYKLLRQLEGVQDLECFIIDVDHFKDYNDTRGHLQGDVALRTIADVVKRYADVNMACRYGGEDFVLFYPNGGHTRESLLRLGEDMRLAVSHEPIYLIQHHIELSHHVTVSIGGAIREKMESPLQMIERADNALYNAKHSGRNAVKISE